MESKYNIKKISELLIGVFLIYLAVFDETIFNIISQNYFSNRIVVTVATVLSATLPMFFAVGIIKFSTFPRRETIYYYEKFIKTKYFWGAAILFFLGLILVIALQEHVFERLGAINIGLSSISIIVILYNNFYKTEDSD